MDYRAASRKGGSAWQATLPTFFLNLPDKWQEVVNISTTQIRQEPKKLTTEAFYILCGILLFVIPSLIGSAISAYESFWYSFSKKKISSNLEYQKNEAYDETNVTTKKQEDESSMISDWRRKCGKFFDCFCIQTNASKILSITSNHGCLDCIDGIRSTLFLWIFFAHFFAYYIGSIKNVDNYIPILKEKPFVQIVGQAGFGIDTFVVLSSFLIAYLFSDYYEKHNGKVPWILFYAVRFLRITPLYMAVLGFYSTLFTYTSSSPVWPTYNTNPVCRNKWIWNLLYINNFLPHYNQCMGMTWFLGCVMQLYVISPLFMIPLKKWPRFGYALSIIAICSSCFAAFVVTIKYNLFGILPNTILDIPETHAAEIIEGRFWLLIDELLQRTYIRLTPYIVGLLLGFYLQSRNPSKKNSWLTLSFGWIMFALLIRISLTALPEKEETLWQTAAFNSVKTLLFSLAFSWLIFVCVTQQAGFMGRFFSHPIFKPISRLSFCAYLTQTMVFEWYFLSVEVHVPESFVYQGLSDLSWAPLFAYMFLWAFVTAFVVSLLFEYPIIRLLQTYFSEKKKTQ